MLKSKAEGNAATGDRVQYAKMANGMDGDRKATFARNLAALNSQFATWVAEQSRSAPKELWTDGVEDYLKYAEQLLADFKDVLTGEGGKAASAVAPAGGSLLGFAAALAAAPTAPAAVPAAPAPGNSKPPLPPSGFFGSSSAAAVPASIFGAFPSMNGAFGLGSSGPAFGSIGGSGAGSAANSGCSGLLNVPSTGTLGSTFNVAGAEAEEEEGEEEQNAGPSVQVEAGEGMEMLAKQRVKLMSMTGEKKWKDKGQGTLTLRRATGEGATSTRPYFVFTTDSGRILINAPLVRGMKPTINAKQPASLLMLLISNVDGVEERCMHLFRCESADAAKQLLNTVTELA